MERQLDDNLAAFFSPDTMKQLLSLLLLLPLFANASDEFGVEEPIAKPDKIPSSVISYLNKNLANEVKHCEINMLEDALEAKTVRINADSQALVVKPKNWCLCAAQSCPMWLFQVTGSTANRIWFAEGTSGLQLLDQKENGYRQIKEGSATAGHGHESIWTWDGKKYRETYRQDWMMNGEKNCREIETYRQKNGKLKKVSTSCVED